MCRLCVTAIHVLWLLVPPLASVHNRVWLRGVKNRWSQKVFKGHQRRASRGHIPVPVNTQADSVYRVCPCPLSVEVKRDVNMPPQPFPHTRTGCPNGSGKTDRLLKVMLLKWGPQMESWIVCCSEELGIIWTKRMRCNKDTIEAYDHYLMLLLYFFAWKGYSNRIGVSSQNICGLIFFPSMNQTLHL